MTGCIYDPIFLEHGDPSHPENYRRLEAITDRLQATSLWDDLEHLEFGPAEQEQITCLHEADYVEYLAKLCRQGGGSLDPDTYATKHTFEAAVMAVGGCLRAAEAVVAGEVDNAICLVRPPGHHALANRGMGFCFFNNVALSAEHLLSGGLERVAIIDWDVHHGNGTHDLFYLRRDVLYISVHQSPLYPGTGTLDEIGAADGPGFTINIPLPPGARDEHLIRVHRELIVPALYTYGPQFVLISAGYDGHWREPLASFEFTTDGYHKAVSLAVDAARDVCQGRMCVVLEGGYDLGALALGVQNTILALQGKPLREEDEPPPVAFEDVTANVEEHLERALRVHKAHLQL